VRTVSFCVQYFFHFNVRLLWLLLCLVYTLMKQDHVRAGLDSQFRSLFDVPNVTINDTVY